GSLWPDFLTAYGFGSRLTLNQIPQVLREDPSSTKLTAPSQPAGLAASTSSPVHTSAAVLRDPAARPWTRLQLEQHGGERALAALAAIERAAETRSASAEGCSA